jgi:resuscitation-promoting factor RpfA
MENEPKRETVSDNRLSRIYREGAWPEPSRQIDAAIVAASRRAARERHPFARRWAPLLAVVAALVLISALGLKAYREQREAVSPSTPDKTPAAHAKEPAPVAEPKAAAAKAAPPPQTVTPPQGFSSTMDLAEAERLERLQRDLGLKRLPSGESPPPAPKAAPAEKPVAALKRESPETPRAGPAQRAPVRPTETLPPASPFAGKAPAATQGAAVFGTGIPPTPPSVQAQPPAQVPVPAQPPVPAQAGAPSAAALPGDTARSVRAANTLERTPQAWIEDIRKLMAEGRSEEAGRELAEFKKRYPDFALPEDLR